MFEVNGGGGSIEAYDEFSIQGGCENLAGIVGGKSIGSPVRVIPDGRVVQVDFPHFIRSVQQTDRFQVGTDLENSGSGKGEVCLLFARPPVDGKSRRER